MSLCSAMIACEANESGRQVLSRGCSARVDPGRQPNMRGPSHRLKPMKQDLSGRPVFPQGSPPPPARLQGSTPRTKRSPGLPWTARGPRCQLCPPGRWPFRAPGVGTCAGSGMYYEVCLRRGCAHAHARRHTPYVAARRGVGRGHSLRIHRPCHDEGQPLRLRVPRM